MDDPVEKGPVGDSGGDDNDQDKTVTTRRQALKNLAYAASVAPGMLVLLSGSSDAAPGGQGNGNSSGPNCDNPGGHIGFNRNGHSAC